MRKSVLIITVLTALAMSGCQTLREGIIERRRAVSRPTRESRLQEQLDKRPAADDTDETRKQRAVEAAIEKHI